MMLNVNVATNGQANKICDKYFVLEKLINIKCTFYDDDYYITAYNKEFPSVYFGYQVNNDGTHPTFFEMKKDQSRYDIHYPHESHSELYDKLKVVSDEAIQDWIDGNHL